MVALLSLTSLNRNILPTLNSMKNMKELLVSKASDKKPRRVIELDACVDYVREQIGFKGQFQWSYWSKKLKGLTYGRVLELVKEAKIKKTPGSWLSWKLSKKSKPK